MTTKEQKANDTLEKRRFVRIVKDVPVEFSTSHQSLPKEVITRDVSEGGLCIETEQVQKDSLWELLSQKVKLNLKINLPNEIGALNVTAQVAWVKEETLPEKKSRFGVRFTEIPGEQQDKLRSYVHSNQRITKLDFIPRKKDNDYDPEFVSQRRQWLSQKTNTELFHIGYFSIPAEEMEGNIENLIGVTQIPIGIAGPLRINGQFAKGDFYVPLSTTEGALAMTYDLGMRILTKSGGVNTMVLKDEIHISPVFLMKNLKESENFIDWINNNFQDIRLEAEKTTHHGKLLNVEPAIVGKMVVLKFTYYTEDAQGLNMINRATEAACKFIYKKTEKKFIHRSNLSSIKKVSSYSLHKGLGKAVIAEATIPKKTLGLLRVTPEELVEYYNMSLIVSVYSGMVGISAHVANAIAALYIACGQDVADVSVSHVGIITYSLTENKDLYISLYIPNLLVGTVGGGTQLGTQQECLKILGCYGSGKAKKFAEIAVATALAGELTVAAALLSGNYVSAHEKYGRNKPRKI